MTAMQRLPAVLLHAIMFYCFLVSVFRLESLADTSAAQRVEVIAIDYPPFISETAPGFGTAFIQLREWLDTTNLNIDPVLKLLPPARANRTVNQESYCASFYPPKSQDQRTFVAFNDKQIEIKLVRRNAEGTFAWTAGSYFTGSRIAVLRNYGQSPLFQDFDKAGAELVPVETVDQGMEMLRLGRVDYAVIDSYKFAKEYSNRSGGTKYQMSRNTLDTTKVGIYIGPECLDLFKDYLPDKEKGAAAELATTPSNQSTVTD